MDLATFIETRMEDILSRWEAFALSLGAVSQQMDSVRLRDHARLMLDTIVLDLRTAQSDSERASKSMGLSDAKASQGNPASTHGTGRHLDGFTLSQLMAEFRALRSSVLHLWSHEMDPADPDVPHQIVRFNEAIDQAIAESVERFTSSMDHARDIFLAMLGHDLRSPLQAISMTAEYFARPALDTARTQAGAARIKRSVVHMSAMVYDLLEFSRLQMGGLMPVVWREADFFAICQRAVDDAIAARPGCDVRLDAEPPIVGECDESRMVQALTNLLDNACQYSTRGTTVTVTLLHDEDECCAEVHNFGAPIPPAALDEIFKPLVQLEIDDAVNGRPRTSVGLGLHIAQRIAEAHGGRISVRSADDVGTTFSICIPRMKPASAP